MMEKGITYCRDESAATAVEYALMVGLIAMVIVGAVKIFGGEVYRLFYNEILLSALGWGG
jgi:Flp pilus assembly pilin Flp